MTIEKFKNQLGVDLSEDILNEKFVEFKGWEFEQNVQDSASEIWTHFARAYAREMRTQKELARIKAELLNEQK